MAGQGRLAGAAETALLGSPRCLTDSTAIDALVPCTISSRLSTTPTISFLRPYDSTALDFLFSTSILDLGTCSRFYPAHALFFLLFFFFFFFFFFFAKRRCGPTSPNPFRGTDFTQRIPGRRLKKNEPHSR